MSTAARLALPVTAAPARAESRAVIRQRSKSFSLAARLLPAAVRDDVVVVYAWCRRVDDAVDEVSQPEAVAAIPRLLAEVESLYRDDPLDGDPLLSAMREVVRRRGIPQHYPRELVEGMAMDARNERYETLDQLLLYCWRVAGTVGLMVCHVMGVVSPEARRRASHLGMAMQLTNVCRDVAEDWQRGRLYLPEDLLEGRPLAPGPVRAEAAVRSLLARADELYVSGDSGILHLGLRARIAVRTARWVYSGIGRVIAARGYDVMAGRAYVSSVQKAWLVLRAVSASLIDLVLRRRPGAAPPTIGVDPPTRFPDDVLPV